ncbi:hypothetical protein CDIK_0341 [Cucumispora dikerogammari]|nr:hypothetical protein CDIK_0341 [Cucumispora dikerogammari]
MTHISYILYKEFFSGQNRLTKHLTFLKEINKCLTEGEISSRFEKETEVIKGHWPKKDPSNKRSNCHSCYSNEIQKTTTVICEVCDKFLCLKQCFKDYHKWEYGSESEDIELTIE